MPYNSAFVDETCRRICDVPRRADYRSSSFNRHQMLLQLSVTSESETLTQLKKNAMDLFLEVWKQPNIYSLPHGRQLAPLLQT